MPHKNEQGQTRHTGKGCGHKILLALCILAAIAYSGFWYFMAGRVENNLLTYIGQAALNGVDIRCRDLYKSGYPLRIAMACTGFSIDKAEDRQSAPHSQDEIELMLKPGSRGKNAGALAFRSGSLTAGAPVYAPHWISAEMGAPAVLKLPYAQIIEADWQKLQCGGDFADKHPRNINLIAEKLSVGNIPFLQNGTPLSADFIRFDSKKLEGDKAAVTLSFDNLSIPYLIAGARSLLPRADGSLNIVFDKAENLYADLRQFLQSPDKTKFRGKSAMLNRLALSFENGGGFTLSGPVAIAGNGLLSGKITVAVNDSAALMRTIRSVFPAQADNLESLLFVLNSMPKNAKGEPQLELDIVGGHMRMGFLKLGKIPPF